MGSTTQHASLNIPGGSYSSSEPEDFSLVLGGPLFQLLRKAHLEGDALELLYRRVLAAVLITWVPLLALSTLGTAGRVSFFADIEVHARFVAALPILIGAELLVHARIRATMHRFIEWRIVPLESEPSFQKAIESAVRFRNSAIGELALLAAVYTLGLLLWNGRVETSLATWYAKPGGRWDLTPAGYWYVFVSIPAFQFILLRWYMRLFIWFRFLWQVNRINLNLIPTHPDRCGGLSFLGKSSYAYGPILFAQGTILAGVIADRVLYRGENLTSFKFQIAGAIVFFLIIVLGPLLMFTPRLARIKRQGLADYGRVGQRYAAGFDEKWVRTPIVTSELLGAADIQSLADMGNSYEIIREMRPFPFGWRDVTRLAVATAAPLTPLLLTIFSPEELILRLAKILLP